jgi:hypothetical protein
MGVPAAGVSVELGQALDRGTFGEGLREYGR